MNGKRILFQVSKAALYLVLSLVSLFANALEAKLSDGTELTTFGIGVHQELRNDIYIGTLLAPPGTSQISQILDENTPKRMSLRFVTKYTNRQLTRMFKQRMAMNNARNAWRPLTKDIKRFSDIFRSPMQPGDEINIDYLPGKGVEVYLNGTKFVEIESHDFYKLLLNIWIGNVPPTKAFKTGILGQISSTQKEDLEARYLAMAPIKGRFDSDLAALTANEVSKVAEASVSTKAKKSVDKKQPTESKKAVKKESSPAKKVVAKAEKPVDNKIAASPKTSTEKSAKKAQPKDKKVATTEKPTKVETKKPAIKVAKKEPPKVAEPEEEIDVDLIAGSYTGELIAKVRTEQFYPRKALKNGDQGTVVASVTIDVNGELVDVKLVEKSGSRELDRAVLKMIRRAAPYPAIPPELKQFEYQFEVPISFALADD